MLFLGDRPPNPNTGAILPLIFWEAIRGQSPWVGLRRIGLRRFDPPFGGGYAIVNFD
jgi:hypothetical protein